MDVTLVALILQVRFGGKLIRQLVLRLLLKKIK